MAHYVATSSGNTPLTIAVWHGEARLCQLLLGSPSVKENLYKHAMLAAFMVGGHTVALHDVHAGYIPRVIC